MCSHLAIHIPKKHRSTVMEIFFTEKQLFEAYGVPYDTWKIKRDKEITAAYVDAWFNHEITDEELEERFDQHPLSTYEEPPIGVIQDT